MSAPSNSFERLPHMASLLASWDSQAHAEHVAVIDSTNTELMRRGRNGDNRTCLLVADEQTAGRGRLGRQWQAQAGAALTFSLGLSMTPQEWSGLSLAVGCCLADSLDPTQDKVIGLKWPNDLMLGSWHKPRKLGGILIETVVKKASLQASRYVVIGVGLNLAAPPRGDYRHPPAGLRELFGPQLQVMDVLHQVLPNLLEGLRRFEQEGFAFFQSAFRQRDVLYGQALRLSDGKQGKASGVDARGVLHVECEHGVVQVGSDEVSVLPMEQA